MSIAKPRGPAGYFSAEETRKLVAAIAAAEDSNRGEVRLHVEQACKRDALQRARELFGQLGMPHTRDDTGVLLYVAVAARKTAVFAGAGIHGAATEGFWDEVVGTVAAGFRHEEAVAGMCRALDQIGRLLREHVGGDDADGDELPNQVTTS